VLEEVGVGWLLAGCNQFWVAIDVEGDAKRRRRFDATNRGLACRNLEAMW
jgi:hypothetical protein